jgi:pimeloyl-ACP methyl ester carboxylesterase
MEQFANLEFGAFLAASPLLRLIGRGDHHPVLVLPGFTGGDRSTVPLRAFLRGQGYWVHGWHLGSNIGPHRHIVEGMEKRLDALHRRHGKKVSVIGWSLGGIYARELARQWPEKVRQVITLGSPYRFREGDRSNASDLYDRLAPREDPWPGHDLREEHRPPLEVPSTSIYTRTDGIVRWHGCIDGEGPNCENIEVRGSHSGLGHNPAVLYVVADRLAQPEGTWAPFRAPSWTRSRIYPRPAVWHPRDGVVVPLTASG